jgi:hypothetical protein
MTSWRQFLANRLNALKSTGPRTEEGKRISRRNALRHGLTAETVIDGLEDGEDYRGFEAAIIADYDAETAVERELVLRLASLHYSTGLVIAPALRKIGKRDAALRPLHERRVAVISQDWRLTVPTNSRERCRASPPRGSRFLRSQVRRLRAPARVCWMLL